jgi:16S rRNA (adenine(1408)-N(1))-methyltransferase
VLDQARDHPQGFFIGIDAVASAMVDGSRRAARKPARGGVDNAMFVVANLENLPREVYGIGDHLTVNFPWGSLLRAFALPVPELLAKVAVIAKPGATLDVLINMGPLRDTAYAARIGLADARIAKGPHALRSVYAEAGWQLQSVQDTTGMLPSRTRWGAQLHHAAREIWWLRAVRTKG